MAEKYFIEALRGKRGLRPPFWFMRQAGRYLPEYREVREKAGSFLELCYNPELACEVTLQPIARFDMDAAILFSDILVIPQALGVEVRFEQGEGPKLNAISTEVQIDALATNATLERLENILSTVKLVRRELADNKALIGFAGAPWTIACYMIEGQGSRDFSKARILAEAQPDVFAKLIAVIEKATIDYLSAQIEAGADAVQLFDSWAGLAPEETFRKFVIEPTMRIVQALRRKHPKVPVIGFPKGSGAMASDYAARTGVDCIGIDYATPAAWAARELQMKTAVQGNLDPLVLAYNLPAALAQAKQIRKTLSTKPFIFNLGHGIVPQTPPEHVQALSEFLKTPV